MRRNRKGRQNSNLVFRTDSFKGMFFLRAARKQKRHRKAEARSDSTEVSSRFHAAPSYVVSPGDVRGDGRPHALHDGLDPVASNAGGHGRERKRTFFRLFAGKQGGINCHLL